MNVIIDIGQAVIKADGQEYFFNPSFLSMTRLGAPEKIVDVLVTAFGGKYPRHEIKNPALNKLALARSFADMIHACGQIIAACCACDCGALTGKIIITTGGKLRSTPGLLSWQQMITLARHLIFHGVMGDQPAPDAGEEKGQYSSRFDARSFVYLAVAHLGLSEADAWNMTMTSFRAAMNAKYPPKEKAQIPTEDEYEKMFAWADGVIERDNQRKH